MRKSVARSFNIVIAGGIMMSVLPIIHGNAESEYKDYETNRSIHGDELMNSMLSECGFTTKPNTLRFKEFTCYTYSYTENGDMNMLEDHDTSIATLFALDEDRNLYVATHLNGTVKENTKIPIEYILGIGNEAEILSYFRTNESDTNFIKLTPLEYGSNTSSDVAVMHYYDCTNVVEYGEKVENNNTSFETVPLYSDTFYGAIYDSPVYSETFNVPAKLITNGTESTAPVTKTIDISWDGSCKVTYRCNMMLNNGDTIEVSEPLNCSVGFYATDYHWKYSYADEYWKDFRTDTSYFQSIDGDVRDMIIEYTYADNSSYIGNNFNFFQMILEPDNPITFDSELNRHITTKNGIKCLVNTANNFTINTKDYIVPIKYPTLGRTLVTVDYGRVTQIDGYTKSLEEELAKVKIRNEYLESRSLYDANGDSDVTIADAQLILVYYSEKISGITNDTFENWLMNNT